jgi:hypothetical protein
MQNLLWKPRRLMPPPPRPNPRVHLIKSKRRSFPIVRARSGVWLRQCIMKRRVSPVVARRQLPKWLRQGWLQEHIRTHFVGSFISAPHGYVSFHGPVVPEKRHMVCNGRARTRLQSGLLMAGAQALPQGQRTFMQHLFRPAGRGSIAGLPTSGGMSFTVQACAKRARKADLTFGASAQAGAPYFLPGRWEVGSPPSTQN